MQADCSEARGRKRQVIIIDHKMHGLDDKIEERKSIRKTKAGNDTTNKWAWKDSRILGGWRR